MSIYEDQFIKFLKSHNALDRFTSNLDSRAAVNMSYHDLDSYFKWLRKSYPEGERENLFISSAFAWRFTSEGFSYWDNLDSRWKRKEITVS